MDEPGLNKLSNIDTATPSYLPSRIPGLNIPSGTNSPLDYCLLFFDSEIIDTVCEISNSYTVLYQDTHIGIILRMD